MWIFGDEYLTADEVSKEYNISKSAPYQWVRRETINSYRYFNYGTHEIKREEDCFDPRESGRYYIRVFKREDVEKKIRGMRGKRIWQK